MFRALERNPNFRLYFAGSVVSNTGTWMQFRVAQDWLVLSLPGTGGSELGITTGSPQFLPILLLSPYAGVIADRFPKRALPPADPAEHGDLLLLALGALAVSGHAEVWMVYRPGVRLRDRHGVRRPGPGRASPPRLVDRDDTHQRGPPGLNGAAFNLAARLFGPGLRGPADRSCWAAARGPRAG